MKNSSLLSALFLGAALILNGAGCNRGSKSPILITGHNATPGTDNPSAPGKSLNTDPAPTSPLDPTTSVAGSPIDPNSKYATTLHDGNQNREKFASDTVYFDTDSSTIKSSEGSKLQIVADYFKGNTSGDALRVEGYCDERGTEQYNVALGDRRAQAVRDYLANLGVDAQRIEPVSLGEANPADAGHGEEHWKKNRRGVFVLMTPK